MTVSSTLYQPTARGRARRLALATAAALAIGAALGASTSRADIGGVYFDDNDNAAAGDPTRLFDGFTPTVMGFENVGLGSSVMPSLTTGNDNVAIGFETLNANTTGNQNIATGTNALRNNSTGSFNDANGVNALRDSTGSRNLSIGTQAGQNLTTGSQNIDIANAGKAGESGTIRIGNDHQTATFIAGIRGTNVGATAQPVVINSNGRLGTAPSASASTASLAETVERLQRQVRRLRERVRGG